jgi:adenylate cyclase
MSTTAAVVAYRFEGFVLDLARGTLVTAAGKDVPLRHKSFRLLCFFLENAGRLLERETLMRVVWPGVTVSDDGLTQCVRDIRRALGDEAQIRIRTVQRRGYMFAAEVTAVGDDYRAELVEPFARSKAVKVRAAIDRPLIDAGAVLPLPDKPSIAVLPFANLSADPEQEYFSDGVADDIITELSRSHSLLVIARNSSFTYRGRSVDVKQVARELGVRYVLEGSVRRSGPRVRVVAQLIDAGTGNHIWAERYDRALQDVFAVQDEITAAVVAAILPVVADAEQRRALRKPPENLGAWEAYQRGLWHMGRGNSTDTSRAQQFFRQAIDADRSLASAYSASAMAIILGAMYTKGGIYTKGPEPESQKAARERASQALAIDPSDADARAILTLQRVSRDGIEQGPAVISALSASLLNNPNAAWLYGVKGMILVQLGDCSGGRGALRMVERLNPRDPGAALFSIYVPVSYYFERDYARAVTAAKTAIERYPNDPRTYRWLAAALGQLGHTDEARDALHMAIQVSPESFTLFVRSRPPFFPPANHDHMLDGLRKAGWQG